MTTRKSDDVHLPSDDIIHQLVKVVQCEGPMHGDHAACVCSLVGTIVKIEKRDSSIGDPSYKIMDSDKLVHRREVEFPIKDQTD